MALFGLSARLYVVVPLFALLAVAGCTSGEIVGANETHVWVKNSALSMGDSKELAQKHCSQFGKTAVLESDLSIADGANSILVYACN